MEDELLIDYLEHASQSLRDKKEQLRKLKIEYDRLYQKDIREEMDIIRDEIKVKKLEIVDRLYESAEELRYIKRYFPDFFTVLLEDEEIGGLLRKKSALYDTVKITGAKEQLARISIARHQLRDAMHFLSKWPGVIKERQLVATYPILKGEVKGDLESDAVIEKIKKMEKALKKEGWRGVISNAELLAPAVERQVKMLRKIDMELLKARAHHAQAKDKSSNAEYTALKMLKKEEARRQKTETFIRHLLLSNPEFLSSLKKKNTWLKKDKKSDLEKIAEKVTARRVREKTWLEKMKKRLS